MKLSNHQIASLRTFLECGALTSRVDPQPLAAMLSLFDRIVTEIQSTDFGRWQPIAELTPPARLVVLGGSGTAENCRLTHFCELPPIEDRNLSVIVFSRVESFSARPSTCAN